MRFSVFTSLALVSATFAAPAAEIQKRQEISNVNFVLDGYKGILANAQQLITKITGLKAGDDVVAVLKEMSTLSGSTVKITEKMITDINNTPGKMSNAAAATLAKPSGEVATTTITIVDDLVLKKDLFVKAKVHKNVSEDLDKLYDVSKRYVTAAKSKVPDSLLPIASPYFQKLLDALKKGIDNFEKL